MTPIAFAARACALSLLSTTLAASAADPDALLPQSGRYETDDSWRQPVAPFRIADHTWYIGTARISALLIATPEGAIVIDGGLPQAKDMLLAHIRAAGVDPANVRWLLTSHAHGDHAGPIAGLKRATGAQIAANAETATMLARGGTDDIHFGDDIAYPPAQADRLLQDLEVVAIGDMRLTAHFTPGHTPGSTSWTWTDTQGGKPLRIAYVDSVSAPGYKLIDNPRIPRLVEMYKGTFATIRALPCDVLLTPHADGSGWTPENTQAPHPQPMTCKAYADGAEAKFDAELAKQRAAQ